MVLLRRVAAGIVIAAALAIVALSVYLVWDAYQWGSLPPPRTPDPGARLEIYGRRVNEMETFVVVLLGITGLYTIALIVGAELAAARAGRRLERAAATSLATLRSAEEKALQSLRAAPKQLEYEIDRVSGHTFEPVRAQPDFKMLNESGWRALQALPADFRLAKTHFEASLQARPDQQRARYGLALVARAEGDFLTAHATLEGALALQNWETAPDPSGRALLHYALACVLARRAFQEPEGHRERYYAAAVQHLQKAFLHPSREIQSMFARDTDEGGDLFALAAGPAYAPTIDSLLLNLSVGAA